MTQVTLDELNAMDTVGFTAMLNDVFEHSPWVAEAVAEQRPFADLAALHDAMTKAVRAAAPERQLALIKSHPDLAGKAARADTLTADSSAEQASAGLDQLSAEEFETFHHLNDTYRGRFGFPFIICVRRHTRSSILRQFERRLEHDPDVEREAALAEIFRIAALRLDQRVAAPDRLKVHGRLSTHVLDTTRGRPAAGIAVALLELSQAGEQRPILRMTTNADGRTDVPLIAGRPVPIGTYELQFAVGAYFARERTEAADPPFLDLVPIRFSVAEPEGHYHVPLLVSPWSYSTYRGS
ncbi:MAG TPA: 2-oxo-4-hydroxy-4-carboxy-5-ureidoimidazoline decarboxylase [Xanthobacteraceae bacterium]|nr:2-oxo-4-hydroxy-4-carboxy-5-ureidoimidazoline decarboxylase [Xanthobacteraceae bacterium]